MEDNTVTTNQCHVCQHLGERQCKYTSHKKYINQKGNESFRIGNISWNSSQKKPQSSYLKSLKENEIQFQFPSQIPVPNKSIQRIRNHQYDQNTKNFQRTLIEKVIENQTPQKVESNQQRSKYNEVTNYQTGNKRQLDLKQFQGYPISVGVLEQQTKRQAMSTTKRPTSFLKHHADAYKKPDNLQVNVLRPKTPSKQIESALKQQKSPITPINSLSPIQVRNTKYHFQYGKNDLQGFTTKQYHSKKPTENSFIVDDQKIINQGGDMLISRVNDKERSSFYANNIFKDYSTIQQSKNKDQSPLKPVLSEFNQQSESPSIIENLQFSKTNPHSPRPQINTERPLLTKKQQLRVTFQCPPRQETQTQRKMKNSNVSRYDFSKHSISTAQQENPHSVCIPSTTYTNHNFNQAVSTVGNERVGQFMGFSPTRHQIMLYPIYPVYEIVYQLVAVNENQSNHNFSNFNQQKTTIFK